MAEAGQGLRALEKGAAAARAARPRPTEQRAPFCRRQPASAPSRSRPGAAFTRAQECHVRRSPPGRKPLAHPLRSTLLFLQMLFLAVGQRLRPEVRAQGQRSPAPALVPLLLGGTRSWAARGSSRRGRRGLAAGKPRPVPPGSEGAERGGRRREGWASRSQVHARGPRDEEILLESNCSMSWNISHPQLSDKLLGKNGVLEEQKSPGFKKRETEVYVGNLPLDISKVLEKASGEGFGKTAAIIQLAPKAPVDLCETEKLRAAFFAVPLEMRGSFLVLLLRECFRDLSWLALIHSIRGEAGLLVTSIVPKTPFFWAMHITEALHQNMQALFSTLAQAEEQQPYLEGSTVTRGTRCLAEYHLGDYGHAWNRCWVLDRVDTWAVVMFIDFGQLATIPVQSLRSLDSDDFWTIPPLTQPFMLEKDILSSYEVVHRILKGKITGALNSASHILKFEESK
ncbi:tudor domain-containing protein 10 isoform X7 [Pan troglodytes]|uniref:tudor domain-containing protein 10 isoform X7 n=1 Tax=Pan troglodytes TaxID=9598 RepID=UPI0023F47B02|nr:tudor domain-containing protein 10 isoform X7 [Pan troglodytes]